MYKDQLNFMGRRKPHRAKSPESSLMPLCFLVMCILSLALGSLFDYVQIWYFGSRLFEWAPVFCGSAVLVAAVTAMLRYLYWRHRCLQQALEDEHEQDIQDQIRTWHQHHGLDKRNTQAVEETEYTDGRNSEASSDAASLDSDERT